MECQNCFIHESPQWRKLNDVIYCNACCIYYKRWKRHKDMEKYYAQILLSINK